MRSLVKKLIWFWVHKKYYVDSNPAKLVTNKSQFVIKKGAIKAFM